MPPENDEEYIQVDTGIECLIIFLDNIRDVTAHIPRLKKLFDQSKSTGRGPSLANTNYERDVCNKVMRMNLLISRYVN